MNQCQHCHQTIAAEKLPERCPNCDQGTVCGGEACTYCRVLGKWIAACTKPPISADTPPVQINAFTREAFCPECADRTTQLLHGYDQDGTLWKGKVCDCGCYQCVGCDLILDQQTACCR